MTRTEQIQQELKLLKLQREATKIEVLRKNCDRTIIILSEELSKLQNERPDN